MINISQNFKKLIASTTVEEALVYLNESIRLIIVDKDDYFLGTLTDGDIRRHLLKSGSLKDKIDKCANFNAVYSSSIEEGVDLFTTSQAPYVVIIDLENKPIKILDSIASKSPITVAFIMAGGKGTRLRPITNNIPKPLVKVGGIPLIDRVISSLRKFGVKKIFISVNYMATKIMEHFEKANFSDITIEYIEESNFLGTAGALSLFKNKVTEDFIVINADVISDINYSELAEYHLTNQADITVVAKDHKIQNPYGVIEIENNKILNIKEKPIYQSYVAAGVYVFSSEFINSCNKLSLNQYLDMPDFIVASIKDGRNIICYPIHEFWSDVGTHKAIEEYETKFNI